MTQERSLAAIRGRLELLGLPVPGPVRLPDAPPMRGRRWNADDRWRVIDEFLAGTSVPTLARAHERSLASIRSVLRAAGAYTRSLHASGDAGPFWARAEEAA